MMLFLKKYPDLTGERFGANKGCFFNLAVSKSHFYENMFFIKLFLRDLQRGFDGMLATFCLKLTRLSQSWEKWI